MPSGRFRGGWGQDLGGIVGRYIDAKGREVTRRLGTLMVSSKFRGM
jgi:hypothetical protein